MPALPASWPIPPLDLLWLWTAPRSPQLLGFLLLVDVSFGQPGWLPRWILWALIWLLGETVPLSQRLLAGVLLSLVWYGLLGPAYSPLAALAVGVQSLWLLRKWGTTRSSPVAQAGWGWRCP